MALSRRDSPFSRILDSSLHPFTSLQSMWEPFNVLENFAARALARDTNSMATIRVDWLETKDAHVFTADLPGLMKEEIKVQLHDDRVLEISGERIKEEEKQTDNWHRVERSRGKFLRQFRLPENVQTEKLSAKVENGVLTVTVPKIPERTPQIRTIEIS